MKKSLYLVAGAVALTALPTLSFAEDSPLTFNVALSSDYRYRGISQSRLKPAVSAGVDYAIPGGFYVGAWASSIKWIKDGGGKAPAEIDIYGGYKGEIAKDLGYDVGVLTYQYPRHKLAVGPNTTEVYGAMTFGPATLKYSHSVTNLFGFEKSKNSGYVDLTASFDVGGGVMLAPHLGYQKVAKNSAFSYTDYSLTVSKDYSGWLFSAAVVGADTKESGGKSVYYYAPKDKELGKVGLVLAVKKTF
jgi:uncharacterized protein (TIGR02001 family)